MNRIHLLSAAILSAVAILPHTVSAQAQPAPTSAQKLEFDVVSIRPSQRKFVLIGLDFLDPVSKMAPPPGGVFSWNIQLPQLIAFAYDLRSPQLQREALQGLPKPYNDFRDGWLAVEARANGNPTRDGVRQMVRSMLEDRFHFAAHIEKHEGDVFMLLVDKPGPSLTPHTEGEPCNLPSTLKDIKKYPHVYPPYDNWIFRCGIFNRELSRSGERRLEMLDVSMDQIANTLSQMASREGFPVIDKTGLTGQYDAILEFAPSIPPDVTVADDAVGAPGIQTALEKQLGLRLVKQKAQVDVFVIDHVEPPTEN